jgi:hypothetical protein
MFVGWLGSGSCAHAELFEPDQQREIAADCGRAAHVGTPHEFTSQEAWEAGKVSQGHGDKQSGSDSSRGGNQQSNAGSGRSSGALAGPGLDDHYCAGNEGHKSLSMVIGIERTRTPVA